VGVKTSTLQLILPIKEGWGVYKRGWGLLNRVGCHCCTQRSLLCKKNFIGFCVSRWWMWNSLGRDFAFSFTGLGDFVNILRVPC